MAAELKHFFSKKLVGVLAQDIMRVHPAFDAKKFQEGVCASLEEQKLLQRAQHISACLHRFLPQPFPKAWDVLKASLGPELDTHELIGVGMAPFYYLPHVMFVAAYGLEHPDVAMQAQYELTKRFSAEFSIRYFIQQNPSDVWRYLMEWKNDPNPHVRRLVSEGTRCRLPWAVRVSWLDAHLPEVVALLSYLKNDPNPMVRRSVANNLNDIGKLNPTLLTDTCHAWLQEHPTPEMKKLVTHALRSAVKRGNPQALKVMGYGSKAKVSLTRLRCTPSKTAVGGHVRVSWLLENTSQRIQPVLVDARVGFVKANGKTSYKTFKVKTCTLQPQETSEMSLKVSLAVHTTRKPYPGKHVVEITVNGHAYGTTSFNVCVKKHLLRFFKCG
jgi:3-methyladenine DNA glycosylase AlkC